MCIVKGRGVRAPKLTKLKPENNMKALKIKATSGGIRGQENSGAEFSYEISRESFLELVGQVYDICQANAKDENKKSGGHVSQFLHAYGVTADKLVTFASDVFPDGGEWKAENTEAWLEAMSFKAKREQKPLPERQAEWDTKAGTLIAAGLDPAMFLSPKTRPMK